MSASTCRHVLSLSGSIAFTVEEYGLIHVRRSEAGAALLRRRAAIIGVGPIDMDGRGGKLVDGTGATFRDLGQR